MQLKQKQNSIYTQLSNKYNLPYQVIEVMCNHPFKFATTAISDPEDFKTIMFGYLFKIKPKKSYERGTESTN